MSSENVEIVRQAFDALASADVERFIALAHRDFEAHVSPELSAEPDTYRGGEGIRRYVESFQEAFDDIRFDAERFTDVGDSVVVALRMSAKGKRTGILVEQRNAGVWTILDGRVLRVETYASVSDALQSVGLEE
jgi:ketosteroid isomerase-like protein